MEFAFDDIIGSLGSSDVEEIIKALKVLERDGDQSSVPHIEKLANHQEVSVRYHAKRALNRISRKFGLKINSKSAKPKIQKEIGVDNIPIPEPVFDMVDSTISQVNTIEKDGNFAEPCIEEEMVEKCDDFAPVSSVETTEEKSDMISTVKGEIESEIEKTKAIDELSGLIKQGPISVDDALDVELNCKPDLPPSKDEDDILTLLLKRDDSMILRRADSIMRGESPAPDSKELKEIEKYMIESENLFIHSSLVKILGKFGGKEYLESISGCLNSPDFRVIANSIEALEFIDDQSVLRIVAPYLRHDDNRIKANAAKCIWKINPQKGIMVLEKMVFSREHYYRDSGIYILSQIECEESYDLLLGAYVKEKDGVLIEKIKENIGSVYHRYPIEKLENILTKVSEDKQDFIVSLIENVGEYERSGDSIQENEKSIEDFSITLDSEFDLGGSSGVGDISTVDETTELSISTSESEVEMSKRGGNSEIGEFGDLDISISVDELASELSSEKVEDSGGEIEIDLSSFGELGVADLPGSEGKMVQVNPHQQKVTEDFEIKIDLENLESEMNSGGEVYSADSTIEDDVKGGNVDFDLSIDIDSLELSIPQKGFDSKKSIPSGDEVLEMVSANEVLSSEDSLLGDGTNRKDGGVSSSKMEKIPPDKLQPLDVYLKNIQSSDETQRIEAVLGLFHYLKNGDIGEEERDTIEMCLDLARGDTSERIREIISKNT